MCNKLPNAQPQDVLTNCVAIAQGVKTVSKKLQTCIVMHHVLFDDGSQIYAVDQYCKVVQEGAVGNLFHIDEHSDLAVAEEAAQGNDCVMQLPSLTGTTVEDISHFCMHKDLRLMMIMTLHQKMYLLLPLLPQPVVPTWTGEATH